VVRETIETELPDPSEAALVDTGSRVARPRGRSSAMPPSAHEPQATVTRSDESHSLRTDSKKLICA